MGRFLVDVPHFTMVNLIARKRVVPELIQQEFTSEKLAAEAIRLLINQEERHAQQLELMQVTRKLASEEDPMDRAAGIVLRILGKEEAHVG